MITSFWQIFISFLCEQDNLGKSNVWQFPSSTVESRYTRVSIDLKILLSLYLHMTHEHCIPYMYVVHIYLHLVLTLASGIIIYKTKTMLLDEFQYRIPNRGQTGSEAISVKPNIRVLASVAGKCESHKQRKKEFVCHFSSVWNNVQKSTKTIPVTQW